MAEWLSLPACEERIRNLMEQFCVPGLSIAIVNGQDIASKAYGQVSIDPPVHCTTNTLFDVASISKPITALAIAILKEDERNPRSFEWDTPVSSLLPDDFVLSDPEATKTVTVEDMLSHRTGLPGHDTAILGIHAVHPDTPRSIVRNMRHLPLTKPVRSAYQYSNIMYTAATHLLEVLTQSSFSSFLQTRIFAPVGMTSTFLLPSAVFASSTLSTPYISKSNSYHPLPQAETPEAQGSGSICTTASDYALFLRAMLHHTSPITSSIYTALTTPRIMLSANLPLSSFTHESTETAYALGWDVQYHPRHRIQIISHSGTIPGFGSRAFLLPSLGVAAVILGNSNGAFDLSAVLQAEIIDFVLGTERPDGYDPATRRLKKYLAQKERRERNAERNAERRRVARVGVKYCGRNEERRRVVREGREVRSRLGMYCGLYWNEGYRGIRVEEKGGELFVDGGERSMPFTMPMEYVKDRTGFRAYLTEVDGREDVLPVKFRVGEGGEVEAVGIGFEEELGKELIWFERRE
ncbi:beta-lactamase/transpeptidase-like protein [Myriangium duriaei CBS 260.36]|uniref:Beta-lactamase/transpeptidase-like protein n=1 Tax=Myriangium duriaei CBS 260.36 TaxID=1168546 RepID=A0A9P4JA50_9PEZI|nr:beta-lactamase/transpeptidase-like protein [Myriangium duriaei CBS 260.36]